MKLIITALILTLSISATASPRKRKPSPSRPSKNLKAPRRTTGAVKELPAGRLIGVPVVITTMSGGQITGTLAALDASTVRIRSKGFESAIGLETVGSISFNAAPDTGPAQSRPDEPPKSSFGRDCESLAIALESIASATRSGVDYTEYGRRLSELRRMVESYISRYSNSENGAEARSAAIAAGALIDYGWARTIWTLRFGSSASSSVGETESPVVADALVAYPELRNAAASGAKLSIDRLIVGLWNHAADKSLSFRSLIGGSSGR